MTLCEGGHTMRWTWLVLVAGFAFVPSALGANTITHVFQYDPNNPDNDQGYTQFEGHLRSGRSPQSPAGFNDSNWSGGDAMHVFAPGGGTRMGIIAACWVGG